MKHITYCHLKNADLARVSSVHARHQAMTLVELLLAMSITSIVALAAGGMLTAVTYGSSERTDLRSLVVRQEIISHRLSAAIRASRQVLESDNEQLVLWVTDANNDQTAQLSEVRWIERNEKYGEINETHLVFPDNYPAEKIAELDKNYVPGSSRSVQTTSVSSFMQTERWADQIGDWLISPSSSTASQSTLVSYRVTFDFKNKPSETIIGAAALRGQ